MSTKEDIIQIARAEAANVVKLHVRAEARAQATIAKKEMADKANVVFKAIEEKLERITAASARLVIITEVFTDILVESDHKMFSGMSVEERKVKIAELCMDKQAQFDLASKAGIRN